MMGVEDPAAGWSDDADTVIAAVGGGREVAVVAHSLGGFTAPPATTDPTRRRVTRRIRSYVAEIA